MLIDFDKVMFPTKEDVRQQLELAKQTESENDKYYFELGFTKDEVNIIKEIEIREYKESHSLQVISSRKSLLESGIISIEDVKEDIRKYIEGDI